MYRHQPTRSPEASGVAAPAARPSAGPLTLPAQPPPSPPAPFPLVASIAPVVAALAIWAITRSPYALVFAAFGPVIAVGSVVDARWQAGRRRRRHTAENEACLRQLAEEVHVRLEAERARLSRRHPSATAILDAADGDVSRWRQAPGGGATTIALGSGAVASGLRVEGAPQTEGERALVAAAATVAGAPVTADAAHGVGVLGPRTAATSVARGYLVQLVHALSPRAARLAAVPADGWEWAAALPHAARPGEGAGEATAETVIEITEAYVQHAPPGVASRAPATARGPGRGVRTVARIAIADALERLPTECGTIVVLEGAGRARIVAGCARPGSGDAQLVPELVSVAQAERYASVLARHARAARLGAGEGLPRRVAFSGLFQPRLPPTPGVLGSLGCVIGMDAAGPVTIDLVRHGPHAVVGGTTGSGKSALLSTWVTAMAAAHGPDEVSFLLVDFKGGAAFAPLATLPHCVGVMTDLDHATAARALASLAAELRGRERALARFGAADVADPACAAELPRLVIVVDEFAAMLDALPELQPVLTDIAARGRSLGVHLILCTQRPAGALRDALLANCGLRLSLRVNNRSDSQYVVGTDAAATLPQSTPGRCIVGIDGETTTIQVASTNADDIARVCRLGEVSGADRRARRPWLDPLPAVIALTDLPGGSDPGFVLGVEDVPQEQRQDVVRYRPERNGSLLAVGAHASGMSTLLDCIAAQRGWPGTVSRIGPQLEAAWDVVCDCASRCAAGSGDPGGVGRAARSPMLLLADDIDSLYSRLGEDYQQEFLHMLGTVLRDGPAAAIWLVATAQRLHGGLAHLGPLFSGHLLLRLPSRQDHVMAGGDPGLFDERMPPGGAVWHGHRVQIAWPGDRRLGGGSDIDTAPPVAFLPGSRYLVVSRAPRSRADRLRAALGSTAAVTELAGARPATDALVVENAAAASVVVGDPDAWQAQWALLASLRPNATMIFDGCSAADVRAIARPRTLPPPLGPGLDRVWLCDGEGSLSRGRLSAA